MECTFHIIACLSLVFPHAMAVDLVKVTEDQQMEGREKAARRCLIGSLRSQNNTSIINNNNNTNKNVTCPMDFDGLACWPESAAGTVVYEPCPNYINFFDMSASAERHCNPNGTWRFSYKNNSTRADYRRCVHAYHTLAPISDITHIDVEQKYPSLISNHIGYIKMVNFIGYSISIVALVVALVIFSCTRKLLKCPRNVLHVNLFISFVIRGVITLVQYKLMSKDDTDIISLVYDEKAQLHVLDPNRLHWECKLITTLWIYSRVSNCMWIFLEALYLHLLIFVITFSNREGTKRIILAGWGVPLLFLAPWVIVRATVDDVGCWITYDNKDLRWIVQAPTVAIVLINTGFFANFVRLLVTKLKASESSGFTLRITRRLAKSTVILIPLFGVHYIVFNFTEYFPESLSNSVPGLTVARMYFDSIFTSLQGLAVSILFCFCNDEVAGEVKKKWNRFRLSNGWVIGSHSALKRHSTQRVSLSSDGGSQLPSRRLSGPLLGGCSTPTSNKTSVIVPEPIKEEQVTLINMDEKSDENQNIVNEQMHTV